jgi:hypothetical protein
MLMVAPLGFDLELVTAPSGGNELAPVLAPFSDLSRDIVN